MKIYNNYLFRILKIRLLVMRLGVTIIGGLTIWWFAWPWLLWLYHINQAGNLMMRGLEWPKPRFVDSIPSMTDNIALSEALLHLDAASSFRPSHAHAYRMMGWIYMANRQWERAASAFEQARSVDASAPMVDWEAGLAYEQMVHTIMRASSTPLTNLLATANITAPDTPIETPFCNHTSPATCYYGITTLSLPYANTGNSVLFSHTMFFLHPSSTAMITLDIPVDQCALSFTLGYDPKAISWGSDGAVYRIGVMSDSGDFQYIFERIVTLSEASAGWIPEWTDLSPWAGKSVTLIFETMPGANNDTTADWFGWGNVMLTSPEAARYRSYAPLARMQAAWMDGGFNQQALLTRRERALQAGRLEEAQRWEERAMLMAEGIMRDQ